MALHWTHSPLIDPPPPPKPMTASQQIDVASWEDKYKFGNMGELKEYLKGLPIRLDVRHFALNDSIIEISDFFSGVMLQDSQWDKLGEGRTSRARPVQVQGAAQPLPLPGHRQEPAHYLPRLRLQGHVLRHV